MSPSRWRANVRRVLPLVAIVGAPNVGKSTLFNRLIPGRNAIVTDEPGVTRDRQYGRVTNAPVPFRIVDTGGLTPRDDAPFAREIEQQADAALDEAALILFVVDARAGATALDQELASIVRRRGKPLLLIANKVESGKAEHLVAELHGLGLGEPLPVSAEHGNGILEMLDRIADEFRASGVAVSDDAPEEETEEDRELRIAIVGRPNVGKSSLLNRLAGEQRAVVSDIAGTTRDSIDTLIEADGQRYRIIDTAGIRRRGKVERGVERYSVDRARKVIDAADVVILLLDGSDDLAAQDAHVAGYVQDAYKPMIIAVNKWDLVEERAEAAKRWEEKVRHRLRFAPGAPFVLISAMTGQRAFGLLEKARKLFEEAGRRVTTGELNRFIDRVGGRTNADTGIGSRRMKLFYATQTGVRPPTFLLFVNDKKSLHFSQKRMLMNQLREQFGYDSVPVRLQVRERTRKPRP